MSNEDMRMKMQALEHEPADITKEAVEASFRAVESGVVGVYQKIEDAVVGSYKKIENSAVTGFEKVMDKCVEVLFTKEGETAAEAKARLSGKEEL